MIEDIFDEGAIRACRLPPVAGIVAQIRRLDLDVEDLVERALA